MSKISTCCRNPRQDWPALKARWMSSQSPCCFRTTLPEIQSLKLGNKMSFKGFWLTSALSSSLSPPGDTYSGVGKSFKALAKFFALDTFALVVGPRVCGIFSISLKQKKHWIAINISIIKSPCTQRGRIHCNTLLCYRLRFWKRPFLAKTFLVLKRIMFNKNKLTSEMSYQMHCHQNGHQPYYPYSLPTVLP